MPSQNQPQPSNLDDSLPTQDAATGADASRSLDPLPTQPERVPLSETSNDRKTRSKKQKTQPSLESFQDQSTTRHKRRKLSLADDIHARGERGSEDMVPQPSSPTSLPSSHPDNSQPASAPHPIDDQNDPTPRPQAIPSTTPPKKMLRLSASGTLVSPPPNEEPHTKKSARRGRPKKEKPRLVVVLRYPAGHALAHRIDGILDGTDRFELPKSAPMAPPPKPKASKRDPSRPTHPFFSGKPKDAAAPAGTSSKGLHESKPSHVLSPRRPSAVTPGKLRAQARGNASQKQDDSSAYPQFGASRDRNIIKQPGMVEAPFPPKGFAHIRGDFYYHTGRPHKDTKPILPYSSRKMKHKLPLVDPSESALTRVEQSLDYHQRDTPRPDGFYDPPPSLRVPTRHLIPGSRIQSWIANELCCNPRADDLQYTPNARQQSAHPACENLFDGISKTLTPFDEGRSEVQAWAQKYSPKSALQVLQLGREAAYLRDWMKALTISAVDTSGSQVPKSDKADRDRKPKKKRRKKTAELDDFIVDDEEAFNESDEYVQLDQPSRTRPSMVRGFDINDVSNRSKTTCSVIISGPSGCGKTAMVYAAAKELGFEIFEINPGSRRSGKDVLDRIGDMVENHLVQNRSADAGSTSADEDAGRLSDAFNKDLESGRQGTMTSFFTSKPKSALQPKKKETKPKLDVNQVQKVLSSAKPSRGQKQSLILLEEVDVMFEEDKNFWSTIFTLLESSKRPIIMTCNDEDLVPIQAIKYQALLRLTPPASDTAIDYLLLMAAQEGHLLSRDAVSTLYDAKHHDLRASIAELQLWCQMGVGDPRGGLGWIYQRWPAGSGIDENGQPIRVVSENTYQAGMGFLAHETNFSIEGPLDDELLKESWEGWDIDPRDKLFAEVANDRVTSQVLDDTQSRMTALKQYSSFSDTLSDTDMFCRVGLPGKDYATIDATQPELPEKTRLSFIHGMALLQTPPILDYSSLDTRLAISCSRLASKAFSHSLDTSPSGLVKQIIEENVLSHKAHHLSRADISSAFDTIASVFSTPTPGPPSLTYSILDGPLRTVVTDVAPYIRSIAAYDLALEEHRGKLHGSSQGSTSGSGAGSKRARTTRAARSALEGGQRQLTRRERWFDPNFDLELALRTAGDWPRAENAIAEARMHSPGFDTHMQVD